MTRTITTDTRGTSKVVGVMLLVLVVTVSATIGGAVVTEQFREETSDETEITESKIDTPTHDQVHITPLVGDDLELENTKVRIEFLDRDAPPAVINNLQAAKDQSQVVTVTETNTIQTAGEYEPVTQEVTYYEQNGTTDEVTVPVYNYSRTVETEEIVYAWFVYDDSYYNNQIVHSTTRPTGWKNVYKEGKLKEYRIRDEDGFGNDVDIRVSYDWQEVADPGDVLLGVKDWHTKTTTETVYHEAVAAPNDNWTKVSDEPVGQKTVTLDEPQPVYTERTEEVTVGYNVTNTTQDVEQTRTLYVTDTTGSDSLNVTQTLSQVDQTADYLDGSAAGVGGTIGNEHNGVMKQGETIVVQLDRPLLYEGERINIEIIDKETNSRVMDRNVRVKNPETFQFGPTANAPAPNAPNTNLGVNPTAPNVSLGNGSAPTVPTGPSNTAPTSNPTADTPESTDSNNPSSDSGSSSDSSVPDITFNTSFGDGNNNAEPSSDGDGNNNDVEAYVVEPSSNGGTHAVVTTGDDHLVEDAVGVNPSNGIYDATDNNIPTADTATGDFSENDGGSTGTPGGSGGGGGSSDSGGSGDSGGSSVSDVNWGSLVSGSNGGRVGLI